MGNKTQTPLSLQLTFPPSYSAKAPVIAWELLRTNTPIESTWRTLEVALIYLRCWPTRCSRPSCTSSSKGSRRGKCSSRRSFQRWSLKMIMRTTGRRLITTPTKAWTLSWCKVTTTFSSTATTLTIRACFMETKTSRMPFPALRSPRILRISRWGRLRSPPRCSLLLLSILNRRKRDFRIKELWSSL